MSDDIEKADADARLIAEAAALSVFDPTIWDLYMKGWMSDVKRRISERFPDSAAGSDGADGGSQPGS